MSKKDKDKDKDKKHKKVAPLAPTEAGITVNAAYYIEKLEQINATMEKSDKVPEPWTKPIRNSLKNLKIMFNNAARLL